jgi:hypothetical protein
LDVSLDTRSPLGFWLVCHSKPVSASMEIREVMVVAPVSATRRFRPTRCHPRRAGTGRAPKASRCWRRHSNLASACTRFFVRRRRHRLSRGGRRGAKIAGKLTHDSPTRAPFPIGISVGLDGVRFAPASPCRPASIIAEPLLSRFGTRLMHTGNRSCKSEREMAELGNARDLKSPGATEITHLSDLTRAGNPHEAGGDPAVLSNKPPPLPLAGRPSKTWADVFLPTSINRRKDRRRLLQSAIASWSLCAAVSTKPFRPPSGSASRRNTPAAPYPCCRLCL